MLIFLRYLDLVDEIRRRLYHLETADSPPTTWDIVQNSFCDYNRRGNLSPCTFVRLHTNPHLSIQASYYASVN